MSKKAWGGLVVITSALFMVAAVLADSLPGVGIALLMSLEGNKLRGWP